MSEELEHLTLNRVIGLTSLSNASFLAAPNGNILYAAGCVCVLYNPQTNKQVGHFPVARAVACAHFSENGKYLAIGERGHLPCVTVWDMKTHKKIRSYSGHEHGISSVRFSPNGKYLVSVGFKHDKQMMLHEWEIDRLVCIEKMENKVNALCFHDSGEFFVTCGDRHLKWWYFVCNDPDDKSSVTGLNGRPASILKAQQDSNFVDVACCTKTTGGGDTSAIFCTTSSGMLCLIHEKRLMDKWVQLDSSASYCLTLTPSFIIVGGTCGDVFVINPENLEFVTTLPHSAPLTSTPKVNIGETGGGDLEFAACYGVASIPTTTCVAVLYADRSVFIWDIADIHNPIKFKSFVFHKACIWDLVFIEQISKNQSVKGLLSDEPDSESSSADLGNTSLPPGTFATCGADNSVCFWNLDPKMQRKSKWKSAYSRDLLHSFQLDNSGNGTPNSKGREVVDGSPPDIELPDRQQGNHTARSLAIHPNGNELACGDKQGKLYIYDLTTMTSMTAHKNNDSVTPAGSKCPNGFNAHEAEVLTMNYSPYYHGTPTDDNGEGIQDENLVLLATAGRDRLIHIFDATEAKSASEKEERYSHLNTLDSHSSSVTVVKFSLDGKSLISCGGDKTMVLHSVVNKNVTRKKSIQTPNGTINGITLDIATNKYAVSTGQDKRVNVWNLASGKLLRSYRPTGMGGEMYKCSMDPSGTFVATCSFDKVIRVFDFFSGEIVAQAFGHSDLITGVKFSPDGKYLLSIGGDGCIMQWSLSRAMIEEMEDRLLELLLQAEKKAAKVKEKARLVATGSTKLPDTVSTPESVPSVASTVNDPAGSQPKPKPLGITREKKAIRTGGLGTVGGDRPSTSGGNVAKPSVGSPKRPTTAPDKESEVQQSKGKLFGGRRPSAPAWAMRKADSSDSARSSIDGGGNSSDIKPAPVKGRWASRDPNQLQILGKPVSRSKGTELHKLTLEMTVEEATWKAPLPASPSKLATSLEDADEVLIEDSTSDSSSDDDIPEGVVDKDIDSDDDDDKLNKTGSQLDELEESALKLETWLERKLREDVALDQGIVISQGDLAVDKAECKVIKNPSERQAKFSASGKAVLGQSLSSTFFRNINKNSDVSDSVMKEHPVKTSASYRGDDLLPPPEPSIVASSVTASVSSSSEAMFHKRQETACAVAQMRERLRQMGILEKSGKVTKVVPSDEGSPPLVVSPISTPPPDFQDDSTVNVASEVVAESEQFAPPPPPPTFVDVDKDKATTSDVVGIGENVVDDIDDDDDAASTVSGGSAVREDEVEINMEEGVDDVPALNAEEEEAMRLVLKNLDEAREKAISAYSNLVNKKNAALSAMSSSNSSVTSSAAMNTHTSDKQGSNNLVTSSTDKLAPTASEMSPKRRSKLWSDHNDQSTTLDSLLSDFEQSFEAMNKSTSDVLTQSACGSGLYKSTSLSKWSVSGNAPHRSIPALPTVSESFESMLNSPKTVGDGDASQQSFLSKSGSMDDSANIEAILEKYSDKLASMVSAKVLSGSQNQDK